MGEREAGWEDIDADATGGAVKVTELSERRRIDDNYALPKPKKILVPPTDEEVFRMIRVARDQYGVAYGHKDWDLRNRMRHGRIMALRILVFLFLWVRVSEGVLLRRSDFNLEEGYVEVYRAYVPGRRRKGEATDPAPPPESPIRSPKRGSARTLPLAKVACDIFDRLFKETQLEAGDYVFSGSPYFIRPWEAGHSLKIIARAANVDPEKIHPHAFRQKGATLLKKYGYSLTAQILGHHDRGATVMRSYDRPFEVEKIQAVEEVTNVLAAPLKADLDAQEKEAEGQDDHAAASEGEASGGPSERGSGKND